MKYKVFNILLTGLGIFCATMGFSQTQWEAQGELIATSSGTLQLKSVSDGAGGSFLVWRNDTSGDSDIWAQWVDSRGNKHWGTEGVAVCQNAGDQRSLELTADGTGGIIVTWQDDSGSEGNIYAQRLNQNGQLQWPVSGLPICTAAGDQQLPQIVSNGQNSTIIVWVDKRDGNNNLYGQRVDYTGAAQWTLNGIPIATGQQSWHQLIPDGNSGAYVVYQDNRNGNYDIYAQRINSSGAAQWTANGVALVTEGHNQLIPKPVLTTDNDLIVAWNDERAPYDNIYAQKITSEGVLAWTLNGISVTNNPDFHQNNVIVCSNQEGGAIIAWWDQRNQDYDIYTQNIASDGSELWQSSGVPVIQHSGDQFSPIAVPDGANGAFFTWIDTRKGDNFDIDIYAQHLNSNGNMLWDSDGLIVCSEDNNQTGHTMQSDLSGGFLVFWDDKRNDIPQIYGQSINDAIQFINPNNNTIWAGSVNQQVEWQISGPVQYNSIHIAYSLTGEDGFPNTVTTNIPVSQTQFTWPVPLLESTTVHLQIQGIYADQSNGYTYTSAPFTVDASGPDAFGLLSPSNDMSTSPTPTFQWEGTQDNLTDLAYYQLWIDDQLFQDQILQTQYTITNEQKIPSGNHTWMVKAVNGVGLTTQSTQTWNFVGSFDEEPPAVFHLLAPTNNIWKKAEPIELTWTASNDGNNNLLKYQLWIDDQLHTDNIAPEVTSYSIGTLTNGQHTWYLVAMDEVLNSRRSEETWTLNIDGNSPSSFELINPLNNNWTNDPTPTFQWQQSSDVESSLTYQLWINDTNTLSTSDTITTLPAGQQLSDGLHQWKVFAIDQVMNTTKSTSTYQIFVDTQNPKDFNLSTPVNNGYSQQANQSFAWELAEDTGSGIHHYELWIDDQLAQDNISTTRSMEVTLTEGGHTWYVKALDHLNQLSQSSSFQFIIDWTAPVAFDLVSPADNIDFANNRPEFTWTASSDQLSGLAKYQLLINNKIVVDNIPSDLTAISPTSGFTVGSHTWKMRAIDNAGNSIDSPERNITFSNTPPVITSEDTLQLTEDIPFQYIATAQDDQVNDVTITISNIPTWFAQSGDTLSGIPREGTQNAEFYVKATDGILSDSMRVVVLVTAVNDAPVVTSSNSATATENQPFEYIGTALDVDNSTLTITYEAYPDWLSESEGKLQGTPGSEATSTTFKVKASDGEKTSTLEVQLKVIQINDPPSFKIEMPTLAAESIDTLIIELDNYVEDPDHDNSQLTWNYQIINSTYVFIILNPTTRKVFIYNNTITQTVQIQFTVRDPAGGLASSVLTITKTPDTGIVQSSSQIPQTIVMNPPYPNPFNPVTAFSFGLPRHEKVNLNIYNLLGQLMDTPIQKDMSPGLYEYQWTPNNLPSGIYLYVLQIGTKKRTGRLIYMQ